MLLLTMNVRLGVEILADNLRIFGPILSNPVDLFTFKSVRKFLTKVSFVKGKLKFSICWDFRLDIIINYFEVRRNTCLF